MNNGLRRWWTTPSLLIALLIATLSLVPAVAAGPPVGQGDAGALETIPGRFVVLFNDGVTDPKATANEMALEHGFKVVHIFSAAVKGFGAKDVPEGRIRALQKDPRVRLVAADAKAHASGHPGEVTNAINRIGAEPGAPANSGNGVDVAILDTGVGPHPDLPALASSHSLNFVTTDDEDLPNDGTDVGGHGTAVAGIIFAQHNGDDVVGVAPDVTPWSLRVLGSDGSGSFADIIAALDFIAAQRVNGSPVIEVANMSLGATCNPPGACPDLADSTIPIVVALHDAIKGVVNAGTTVVVSAGNEGTDANNAIPAGYDEVVTVSAFYDTDGQPGGLGGSSIFIGGLAKVDDDSFVKDNKFSNHGQDVDVIAPGLWVVTLDWQGGTKRFSGTSASAPYATAVAALFIAANSGATPAEVRGALIQSGECPPSSSLDGETCTNTWPTDPDDFGEPLVDAAAASRMLIGPPPTLTSISVTPTSASIEEGQTQQFTATGTFSDNSIGDLTSTAMWVSSNLDAAAINDSGLATGVLAGTSNVTAAQGGVTSNSATLEVTPRSSIDTVVITKANYSARKQVQTVEATSSSGGLETLTATAFDSGGFELGSTPMEYSTKKDKYKGKITGLATKPFRVEVTSTGGGSDSVQGSEIGGKSQ